MTETETTTKIDKSVTMLQANLLSIVFIFPLLVIPSGIFILIWGWTRFFDGIIVLTQYPLRMLLGLLVLTVIHELLHGLTWRALTGYGREEISYNVQWKTFTPYAHIKKPIPVNAYRWGGAMPGLVLGVAPALVGLALGNGAVFFAGAFMTLAAAGDILVLLMLRGVDSSALVEDHPTNAGCYVLLPEGDEAAAV